MKSTVTVQTECRKEILIELSPEEATEAMEALVREWAPRVRINGFRKGKVPLSLVKKKFYPELEKSLLEKVASETLPLVLRENALNPVTPPVLTDFQYEEGKPLIVKATVDVWPEFDLPPAWDKIPVKQRDVSVRPEEVDRILEELRQRSAEYIPVEGRTVREGDYVIAEVQRQDVRSGKKMPVEKGIILAGHPENEPDLNVQVMGMAPGEEKTFSVPYGEDYPDKRWAGKTLEIRLQVVSIKEKKLPELNDDFAKTMGEFDSLEALRQKVQEDLKRSKEKDARREMAEEALRALAARWDFCLPESLLEQEFQEKLREEITRIPPPEVRKMSPEALEALQNRAREEARLRLKSHVILRKIQEKEGLQVTEEEVDEELAALARENNIPLARFRQSIEQGGRKEEFRHRLLMKKAVDILLHKAIIIS